MSRKDYVVRGETFQLTTEETSGDGGKSEDTSGSL